MVAITNYLLNGKSRPATVDDARCEFGSGVIPTFRLARCLYFLAGGKLSSLVVANMQRPDKSFTSDEMIGFCSEHLGANKVPRAMVVIDNMPLNPKGKILKKELAELLVKAAP